MGYSMRKNKTYNKKKIVIVFFLCVLMLLGLMGRLVYLMVFRSDYYSEKADELHERERFWMPMGQCWRQTGPSAQSP